MKIYVVIPTRGEWCLAYCIRRVRKHIPVNQLILVGPSNLEKETRALADVYASLDEKNVGKSRARGLEHVETEFYASIDSDVLINPQWYDVRATIAASAY